MTTFRFLLLALAIGSLVGCGAAQALHDRAVHATQWMRHTGAVSLNLDILPPTSAPVDATVVRLYSLSSAKAFQSLTDAQWLTNDVASLHAENTGLRNRVLPPDASLSVHLHLPASAQYLGIVVMDARHDAKPQRLLLARKQWPRTGTLIVQIGATALSWHVVP